MRGTVGIGGFRDKWRFQENISTSKTPNHLPKYRVYEAQPLGTPPLPPCYPGDGTETCGALAKPHTTTTL